jgi:hypothetical protein
VIVDEITHAHATTYESVLASEWIDEFRFGMAWACAEYAWRIFWSHVDRRWHSEKDELDRQENTAAQAL